MDKEISKKTNNKRVKKILITKNLLAEFVHEKGLDQEFKKFKEKKNLGRK